MKTVRQHVDAVGHLTRRGIKVHIDKSSDLMVMCCSLATDTVKLDFNIPNSLYCPIGDKCQEQL